MTYYKVVREVDNKLLSLVHPALNVEYKIGEWTYPKWKRSSLMCVNSLFSAASWARSYYGTIYICDIVIEKRPIFLDHGSAYHYCIEDFWKNYEKLRKNHKQTKNLNQIRWADENTVFCKKIMLLKNINNSLFCLFFMFLTKEVL